MKVFISWSGERSKAIASALRDFIPDALQDVETWMSEHEIAAGSRWANELTEALEGSSFGIICLTPENLTAPWLLFEAGSLSKSIDNSRVIPYLFNLGPADVQFPLAQFQGAVADQPGTLKLLEGINGTLENPLPTERLKRIFERWWPDVEMRIREIPETSLPVSKPREERELLEEILELVRGNDMREQANKIFVDFLNEHSRLEDKNLQFNLHSVPDISADGHIFLPEEGIDLDKVEITLINQALSRTNGNRSQAARMLGIGRDTLLYRMQKYNLR